jgi:hypothetical protein
VKGLTAWLSEPVPRARVAWLRTFVYLYVAADLVFFSSWVSHHAEVSGQFYRPLLVARLLHLPTPTHTLVETVYWVLLPVALVAASGRAPRLLGWAVLVLYGEWMVMAMSYGKVDHDRFAFLVALAVLPTAGAARHRDTTPTGAGGWALRVTQIAAVATYFLSAWAKLRFGGPGWLTGATLTRALLRRGTPIGVPLTEVPGLLVAAQFGIVAFELFSPMVFVVPKRWRYRFVAFFYLFHLSVFATITISFAPQQVALLSFLPLERLARWLPRRSRSNGPVGAVPTRPLLLDRRGVGAAGESAGGGATG